MTYEVITLDWNDAGRIYVRGALEVGSVVLAIDLEPSCGYCLAEVTEVEPSLQPGYFRLQLKGVPDTFVYWPGADTLGPS